MRDFIIILSFRLLKNTNNNNTEFEIHKNRIEQLNFHDGNELKKHIMVNDC